ncbi:MULTISPECIES: VWA domain-containing protein [Ferrimonas]|uniref:vWA domain-containing protein n=1 Tax=Ferrimonas TaxID=44011 RepID=UPI00041865B4|nr:MULTISPECIES: VWA domain-containing protein [Ferrimonas]USD37254.1 VWA domain-containing protein [Ferrimonas sp. SCSIO 43195]
MLIRFFFALRRGGIPVSVTELLALLEAMDQQLAFADLEQFYVLARLCLVKDETQYDKFDRTFGAFFEGLDTATEHWQEAIPDEWLRAEMARSLTEEERRQLEAVGGIEALLAEFRKRFEEQQKRHQGGNRWIGTGGTSPFGHSGERPGGMRVGGQGRNRSAAKVWQQRQYRNLDGDVELGIRNLKLALRKLRRFARTGADTELDLDGTIQATADSGGLLDVKLVPERHNAIKLLLFFDVGGSMDPYVRRCEQLFSACRSEFKHLEQFYFHNFLYDQLWRDNRRRREESTPLAEILRTYPKDYKVIVVGDASMGPYEIFSRYGSVELMNEEPGAVSMQRVCDRFSRLIWLNPVPREHWRYTQSIGAVRELIGDRMYPLTLSGLEQGIGALLGQQRP